MKSSRSLKAISGPLEGFALPKIPGGFASGTGVTQWQFAAETI
jgi:hypothetical protein